MIPEKNKPLDDGQEGKGLDERVVRFFKLGTTIKQITLKYLLALTTILILSCTKPKDDCRRVQMFMDSLSGGKVVSSYKGYDQTFCKGEADSLYSGWQYYCDSFHVRRVVVTE